MLKKSFTICIIYDVVSLQTFPVLLLFENGSKHIFPNYRLVSLNIMTIILRTCLCLIFLYYTVYFLMHCPLVVNTPVLFCFCLFNKRLAEFFDTYTLTCRREFAKNVLCEQE